jgi:tetratricopeptide (TPR) repeat protein
MIQCTNAPSPMRILFHVLLHTAINLGVLEKVQNDQLNSAFAKVCVSLGRYDEACKAYERAKDIDKVVELKLRNLDQVQQAFDLVRQTGTAQGAQLVAEYCKEINDFRGSIEFLLLANNSEEAFKLAQSNGLVDIYTTALGESITSEDALRVAHFFEKAQDFGKAGRYEADPRPPHRNISVYLSLHVMSCAKDYRFPVAWDVMLQ